MPQSSQSRSHISRSRSRRGRRRSHFRRGQSRRRSDGGHHAPTRRARRQALCVACDPSDERASPLWQRTRSSPAPWLQALHRQALPSHAPRFLDLAATDFGDAVPAHADLCVTLRADGAKALPKRVLFWASDPPTATALCASLRGAEHAYGEYHNMGIATQSVDGTLQFCLRTPCPYMTIDHEGVPHHWGRHIHFVDAEVARAALRRRRRSSAAATDQKGGGTADGAASPILNTLPMIWGVIPPSARTMTGLMRSQPTLMISNGPYGRRVMRSITNVDRRDPTTTSPKPPLPVIQRFGVATPKDDVDSSSSSTSAADDDIITTPEPPRQDGDRGCDRGCDRAATATPKGQGLLEQLRQMFSLASETRAAGVAAPADDEDAEAADAPDEPGSASENMLHSLAVLPYHGEDGSPMEEAARADYTYTCDSLPSCERSYPHMPLFVSWNHYQELKDKGAIGINAVEDDRFPPIAADDLVISSLQRSDEEVTAMLSAKHVELTSPLVVYCVHAKCNAAARLLTRLYNLGYVNAFYFKGGVVEARARLGPYRRTAVGPE